MAPVTPSTKGQIIAYARGAGLPKPGRWIAREMGLAESTPLWGCKFIRSIKADPKGKLDVFATSADISPSTARRVASKHGYHSRIARTKCMISAVNCKKRMAYARENAKINDKRVMYTDEACFYVGDTGQTRVIRQPGTEYDPKHLAVRFQHGKTLHVWGAIMYGVKLPLVRFELAPARTEKGKRIPAETITSKVYARQILWGPLQDYVNQARARGIEDVLVVEDGASVHFKGPAAAIRSLVNIPNLSHPPSSPDLNPIEGCWGIVKAGLRRMDRRPTSVE
ncbi:hypothetical protein TREMEDRAFT_61506 [Tremella mesenterica DSM 1558]|uniref:uncharacterized protein n=1 Tax=Tremella mesenterica (strain ATCC 24925 / CBS 8224 / DSM 1558 / NBRC 9311 / NRRL Y-6157 / RJB 2259-6 / UBC 559-6) TaxID=578456 RepID=UPI0003F4A022|nr:uncharacterized protein TREMEDRAFT_61506 [Tremella mesenterica DSM 1558]EIW69743.1 hypothetical protein TREMEDRAFT_61506 [Tremella mesenterica DSM 1558]